VRLGRAVPGPLWAAVLALIALLGVVSVPLWHHHDDADSGHPDCAVCAIAADPTSDGLPPHQSPVGLSRPVDAVFEAPGSRPHDPVERVRGARAPPAGA